MYKEKLAEKIEDLRKDLNEIDPKDGEKLIEKSCQLDTLINEYLQRN
ncbi:aspartyl-phosphate phosphatase Spo0E family protein [Fuchsiella alkaliacetigena]|nr:aspartyl-phosphate phosphatase Spo0E family protein [Fuchsiella alkaliacetigena]MCK8825497.1 aspartyl-phosphate phosphatase Spo0E family protein [Fuchsiella alkaliacetigena]